MDPKLDLKSNTPDSSTNSKLDLDKERQISEKFDREWKQKEETLKKVLDPIALDDSADAWKLRNSFLESVEDMKEEIQGLERKLREHGYRTNDIGMLDKEMPSPEELSMRSDFYNKRVLMDQVLKTLALNLSSITSDESLVFREKLFEMGTHISYLVRSLENVYEENTKARQLFDKFLIEWAKIQNINIDDL